MAIYHFSVKVISRASGRSAVAAAAYRAGERLHDERLDRDHDFRAKSSVEHSEILLPVGAPERFADREKLWNEVEATEKRKDAQLSREVEFSIPREMSNAQGIELARDFVGQEFVARGMIADLNVHWDIGADGQPKPHAHIMLTMREVGPDGFGAKERDWNRTEFVHRHTDGKDQYDRAMSAVRGSPDLVALGKDGRGEDRFTSRDMIDTEQRLSQASELMAERKRHRVDEQDRAAALASAEGRGLALTGEQRAAFEHVTGEHGLSVVVGYAGTGKSAMLGVAREAWERAGYEVRGAALSGIAAEGLENGSGIASRTIASMEHGWSQGRDMLTASDVLVIDEAGMDWPGQDMAGQWHQHPVSTGFRFLPLSERTQRWLWRRANDRGGERRNGANPGAFDERLLNFQSFGCYLRPITLS